MKVEFEGGISYDIEDGICFCDEEYDDSAEYDDYFNELRIIVD